MSLVKLSVLMLVCGCAVLGELCPKQCDCDSDKGLNRAECVEQNIVSIDVGVPRQVQDYSLSRNGITELDNFCFKEAGYKSITVLNLSFNLIMWIGLHAFYGLEDLVNLDLSTNRLREIQSDLFWDTPNLQHLDLSGNIFETLKNEPFIMHSKLQVLSLSNSRIKALPDRLFSRLPNLRKLDLSDNYMITVSAELLRPMRRLQRVELHGDFWRCNPAVQRLEAWISARGISHERQCLEPPHRLSEKMIALVTDRAVVDVNQVWNVTAPTAPPVLPVKPPETLDQTFPPLQAFIIGLEVGLAAGVVGAYVWLRRVCRPWRRRRRRRAPGSETSGLLWSTAINPELATPPSLRRQLSLPARSPPAPRALRPGRARDAVRADTPPPPYYECRVNM